jgi:SAM-dependent methyltransferase
VLNQSLNAACPQDLRDPLTRYLAGEISGEVALMHFVLQLGGAKALESILDNLAATAPEVEKLAALVGLAVENRDHLAQVTLLARNGLLDLAPAASCGLSALRTHFDRAVAISPEASVALYSLGSSEILDRASNEIVERLGEWKLLRSDLAALDIGCGIGRIERALAPRVGAITAIDLSPGMIDEARRRCRDLANVTFQRCDGRDLAVFAHGSFDLILAIDSFPYLFAADPEIAAQHIRDCVRLLRSGGSLVILNFSYRGDDEADRRDMEQLAAATGFTVERLGTRDFLLWDGMTFLFRLPFHRE